jgi:hypothetical protein
MAKTHTSGCYFCHALKRPYEPAERATALEANVDWHRHVLADHADLAWTQDNEAMVREFIEANTQPSGTGA